MSTGGVRGAGVVITITRDGYPGWVPHRYEDGTYCLHTMRTSDPIHHKTNAIRVHTLEEVAELLRTGKYTLRMFSGPSSNEQSLIAPSRIRINGEPIVPNQDL